MNRSLGNFTDVDQVGRNRPRYPHEVNVYVGVFLSCSGERNSSHSQSRSKASLLCVFSGELLSWSFERISPHSQGSSKVFLLYGYVGVFLRYPVERN